jgi:tetratricopeptide (TPR) repeat protein
MRRLNVKLFLYCVAGIALATVALVVVHQLQAGNISAGLLYQAEQAEKEGRLKQATRYLGRYLDFVPNDVEARARLGRMLADPSLTETTRGRQKARFVLEQVLSRNPERHDVRRCLVRVALDAGELELAEEHLEYLKKALPDDGEVAGLVGRCQEIKGKTADALKQLRLGVKNAPKTVDNYVRLIGLLRRMDRGQGGQHLQEAEAHLATALKLAPDDPGVLVAAADLAIDRNELPRATGHLDRALKAAPSDRRVHLARARLALRSGKNAEAADGLRRALHAVPEKDRYELTWALANVLLDAGSLDDARKVIAKLRDDGAAPGTVDYLEARALMHQGRWFEAARMLEQVRASANAATELAVQVDLMLGSCYERLDEPAQQLAACERAARTDPASVPARKGMAAALWSLGQVDAAIESYRAIVKLNEVLKVPVTGRAELARMLLLRTLQMEKRDWRPFEEELEAAEKEQPGAPELVLLRAELFASKKRFDEAGVVIALALKQQPRRVEYWTALANLAERKGNPERVRELLDEAQKQAGDSVELRLARARFWGGRPAAEAGPALSKLEEGLKAFPEEDQCTLLNGLAEAQMRSGDAATAARLWGELGRRPRHARDLRLRLLLFDLAMKRKDDAAMQQALEEVRALEGGTSALSLFGEASRRLFLAREGDRKSLAQVRALLDKVVTLRPAWPAVLLAKAELEQLEGNVEQAIANYRRALEGGARSPAVVRQLVELLSSRQRYDEAEAELRKAQQQAPLPAELQRMLVVVSLQTTDFARAEQIVRDAMPKGSTNYHDYLWTAQMLARGPRRSADAEKAFRRAVELADTVPETWVALVRYLAATGQTAKAEAEVERASARLTGKDGPMALALCYEAAGKVDRAREQFRAALEARPQDVQVRRNLAGFCLRTGALRESEPHLRAILDHKVNAGEADVAWARRALALTLASGSEHKRLPEALKLVGVSLNAKGEPVDGPAPPGGWSAEDQVIRARVLATQSRRPFRARAVALLQEVHKRQTLSPDDQLLLAQLYLAMGGDDVSWAKAREQMQLLVDSQPRNPVYLTLYAQALLDKGDPVEAERIVARLEQIERSRQASLGAAELKARVLELRGKGPQALAVLKEYAEARGARPERMLLYAGMQGRLGHLREALDLCQQALKTCPPEAVGGASVAVLRDTRPAAGKPEDKWKAQAARVEGWLRDAAAKSPDSAGLRLQLADLLDLTGRSDQAEPLYRQVLERDAVNHVALNNLAWLLAQRKDGAAEALTLIGKAMELYGPRPEFLDTRAVAYLTLGQTEQALADLEKAIADAPSATKYFHLTRAHHMARNPRAARAALTRANAAGLTAERLHPAERATYRQLVAELQP